MTRLRSETRAHGWMEYVNILVSNQGWVVGGGTQTSGIHAFSQCNGSAFKPKAMGNQNIETFHTLFFELPSFHGNDAWRAEP